MHNAAQKFTFDNDFGVERRGGTARRAQDRAIADEAERRGYAAGFEAGLAAQRESDASRMSEALAVLADSIAHFEQSAAMFFAQCEREAVALACSLADLLGARVNGFDPHAGFAAAAHEVLAQFPSAARCVARVPAELRALIEARLVQLAADARFQGRLIVEALPEDALQSDFALEWPDGALQHDRRLIDQRLRDEFQRFGFLPPDVTNHG